MVSNSSKIALSPLPGLGWTVTESWGKAQMHFSLSLPFFLSKNEEFFLVCRADDLLSWVLNDEKTGVQKWCPF